MKFIENEYVELKSQIVKDICKEIVAFANSKGGTLYIGIEDDGTVIGVENIDTVMLQINNMIRDTIKPDLTMFIHYDIQNVEDKNILAVTVQKGTNRPYYLSNKGLKPNGVYVRNGASSDPATDNAIRAMIKETDGDSYETMRSLEQSLTFENTKIQFEKRNIGFDVSKMHTLGLLSVDGVYSNVGLLLSDQCNSTIKVAMFSGIDKNEFQDRREFTGSLFQQMDEVYEYLCIRNQIKATFEGLYRKDTRDYPEEAVREALLNMIIHRDYAYGASSLINIYTDRIEFISIGGLPKDIELEDIMLGLSICRNPKLAAIFYRLKLIEAYGTGIPKIINAYKGTGLKPIIEVTNHAFKITLPNCNVRNNMNVVKDSSTSYEISILNYIESHGYITRNDISNILEVSQSTANRILRQMIHNNIIYSVGRGKTIRYKRK